MTRSPNGAVVSYDLATQAFEREEHAYNLLGDLIPLTEQALALVAETDSLIAERLEAEVPWWGARYVIFSEMITP